MSNRRRVNISVDPVTYDKLQQLKSQYGFKSNCELVVAFLHMLFDRLENPCIIKHDISEDEEKYIEKMFEEFGHVESTPDGVVPVRRNSTHI